MANDSDQAKAIKALVRQVEGYQEMEKKLLEKIDVLHKYNLTHNQTITSVLEDELKRILPKAELKIQKE